MSPNGGVTQSIATAKVKPPHVSKKSRDTHISRRWHLAPSTPLGNYVTTAAKHI